MDNKDKPNKLQKMLMHDSEKDVTKNHMFFHQTGRSYDSYKNHYSTTIAGNEAFIVKRVGDKWIAETDFNFLKDYLDDCYFSYTVGLVNPFNSKTQTSNSSVDGYELHLYTDKEAYKTTGWRKE